MLSPLSLRVRRESPFEGRTKAVHLAVAQHLVDGDGKALVRGWRFIDSLSYWSKTSPEGVHAAVAELVAAGYLAYDELDGVVGARAYWLAWPDEATP